MQPKNSEVLLGYMALKLLVASRIHSLGNCGVSPGYTAKEMWGSPGIHILRAVGGHNAHSLGTVGGLLDAGPRNYGVRP